MAKAAKRKPGAPRSPNRPANPVSLDADTEMRLLAAVRQTWSQIGSESEALAEEAGEKMSNEAAIEGAIDANRVAMYGGEHGKAMDALIGELCKSHGHERVMAFLKARVRLA